MESPIKDKRLQALNTQWNNHSDTSIHTNSDTATFHSAQDIHRNAFSQHLELQSLKSHSPIISQLRCTPSPTIEALKMPRKDSGFSDTVGLSTSASSSRRTSTSSHRKTSPSKSKRRTYQGFNNNSRPTTRRSTRSSPQTAQIQPLSTYQASRPSLSSRHTVPYPSTPPHNPISQYFQFPSLPTPESSPPSQPQAPPPPPATVHYWTSNNTRRLEYAAIDAASQGLRGFVTRLMPDCILPKEYRRTKFCQGDEGSDAGSVRRYRLDLPDEDEEDMVKTEKEKKQKPGFFRRMSGGFRRSPA